MPSSDSGGTSPDWMALGACHGEDPELFFPVGATGPALQQVSAAKAVCDRCAVRGPCLSRAMTIRPDGVWGGTTQEERDFIRRSPGYRSRELAEPLGALRPAGGQASFAGE